MNKENIIKFLKDHMMVFIMNFVLFIILFFLIPLLFSVVNPIIWRLIFLFVIAITTILFYLIGKMKYEHVLYSLPILFILNIIILKYCTIRDLYGITSHGSLDKCPAIIDTLLVDMVIVFIEYVSLFITRLIKNIASKSKKVEVKVEEKKAEKKKTETKTETKKVEKKKVVTKKTTSKKKTK